MTGKVFVLGSINIDVRLGVTEIVRPGHTVLTSALGRGVGGKGANQAVAVAACGVPVELIGAVGSDADGVWAIEYLQDCRVDTGAVAVVSGDTGQAIIQITPAGQNAILVQANANTQVSVARAVQTLAAAGPDDVLVAQLEVPVEVVTAAFRACRERGMRTVLNPSPAQTVDAALLHATDVLVVNEAEGAFYSGLPEAAAGSRGTLEALRALGVRAVVQTLGAAGVAYLDQDGAFATVAALPTSVVDTTGAGDAFLGGMVAAWVSPDDVGGGAVATGVDLGEACAAGNAVAARCVAVEGPLRA